MDDLQLTKEFEEATAAISRDILQNPQKYKQAGKWLDQYYDKEFCQKKMQERSDVLLVDVFVHGLRQGEYCCPLWHSSGCPTVKAYEILQAVAMDEFDHFVSMWDILGRDDLVIIPPGSLTRQMAEDIVATWGLSKKKYSWLKDRLWLAHKEMLEIKGKCKFIGQEESVRVCLLTWLLANPDADKTALGITEFDRWEWYSLYESGVCSQRADVIQLLHACKMLQDWQNLTCEAWQNIKNIDSEIERPTKKDVNPAFNDVGANLPAETKHGRLQQIIEILKNWQKLAKKDKVLETAKSALPPIAETYDILCRLRGQCGAKTTNIISWLGFATLDGSGYYLALLNEFANPEVISDLEKWQKKPAETEQVKKQLNESQKSLPPGDYLYEVSKQINEFIVGCPASKNKFCEHIEKVIKRAEEYGGYLRTEWQKAKEAKLTQYNEGKDEKKWFWWTAYTNDWMAGDCVYFANEECLDVQFYIEGKPKRDPLCYLSSMVWGCVGQDYEGLELLDYQFVLLAIIHDAQNWQAGRERIYFNPLEKETLSDRLCRAVWHRLEGFHNSHKFKDIQDTINTALRAVVAEVDVETEQKTSPEGKDTDFQGISKELVIIAHKIDALAEGVLDSSDCMSFRAIREPVSDLCMDISLLLKEIANSLPPSFAQDFTWTLKRLCKSIEAIEDSVPPQSSVLLDSQEIRPAIQKAKARVRQDFEKVRAEYSEVLKELARPNDAGTKPRPKRARHEGKYTPEKIKNMLISYDKHLHDKNDVKYAWNCVAEEHGIPSSKAAEMAVRRYQKKNK